MIEERNIEYQNLRECSFKFQRFIFLPAALADETMSELTKVLPNNRDVDAIKMNQFNRDDGIFIAFLASLYHLIEYVGT